MTTTGLVISNDLILRGETRAVLSELEMACTCSGFAALERTLRSAKFDCIFLDFDDRDKALAAIEMVRRDRMNRYAIVFALSDADCQTTAGVSYSVRRSANFQGELKRCFLAARSLVIGEKRRYQRHPVDIKVACVCGDRTTQARIIDLSERGACVAFPYAVVVPVLQVSFALPGMEHRIQTDVKVAWREEEKAGIQFLSISDASRTALREWLANRTAVNA